MRLRTALGYGLRLLSYAPFNIAFAQLARRYAVRYADTEFWRTWTFGNVPHWYDHSLDYWKWPADLHPHWLERGIYAVQVMTPGCKVLDIGCGDGFYSHYFYASIAGQVDAIDLDRNAIAHARRYHAHSNLRFVQQNAVTDRFPDTNYEVIVMDGALGHFQPEDLDALLRRIRAALAPGGLFVGFEVAESEDAQSWDHPIALPDEQAFRDLLAPYFPHVAIYTNHTPGRYNVYFRCGENAERLQSWQ